MYQAAAYLIGVDMENYRQAALNIAFLTMLLSAGLYPGSVGAADQKRIEKSEPILETFEANDYESWKRRIGNNNELGRVVGPDEFHEFVAARQAARSGDYDKAIVLARRLEGDLRGKIKEMTLS